MTTNTAVKTSAWGERVRTLTPIIIRDFAADARPRVAAVALSIARDAIDSFTALARGKTPALATSTLATQHTTHERVGRAEALLRAGRAFLYETVRAALQPDLVRGTQR